MASWDKEFRLILKHTVKIGRRSGFTTTAMGDRKPSGETLVTAATSVYFDYFADSNRLGGHSKRDATGDFRALDAHMFCAFDQDIKDGDMVYPVVGPVGMTMMTVIFTRPVINFDGQTHHLECGLVKVG